ncbi:Conserved_hypothetical protein [Hexamita inflata]|uniref:Uncharacterized protein n=1 Tax=Hexamita inflata TaxID=28002 RepID=A0AA86UMQ3_9EUKA|nr:Conserved hypothetical protein [Hexamita inflata]
MLSSIILFREIQYSTINENCNKFLLVDNTQYLYCQKQKNLNSFVVSKNLQVSQQSSHMFLYTDLAQNSNIQVNMNYINVFAVFGFNLQTQNLTSCSINVTINFNVVSAALLCIKCDLNIDQSTLVFIATGQKLSGVLMESQKTIIITSTSIQYRFGSLQSSGIVNQINSTLSTFKLQNVKLTGFNFLNSSVNGYFVSQVNQTNTLTVINVQVCDYHDQNITILNQAFGVQNKPITVTGTETKQCASICPTQLYTYGLCLNALELGEKSNIQVCVFPFVYNGEKCMCSEGYVLNLTTNGLPGYCIDLVETLTNLDINISSNFSKMDDQLQANTSYLETQLIANFTEMNSRLALNTSKLDTRIHLNMTAATIRMNNLNATVISNFNNLTTSMISNKSYLETQIINNFTLLNNNIKANVTQLNSQLSANQNYLEANLVSNFSLADSNLARNTTELDNRIRANVTSLTNSINTLTVKVNDNLALITSNLASNKQYLETQIINNATKVNAAITSGIAPIRTDLTNVNSALTTLTTNLRNDLNWVNGDLNAKIKTVTDNANWAQARINAVNNDIGGLRYTDNQLQIQINAISARIAPVYWRVIQTPTGYYGAMVNTLQLCVNGDCRSV